MRIITTLLALAVTSPAFAYEPVRYIEDQAVDSEFSAGDWTLSVLSGTAGGALGVLVGAPLGLAMAGSCSGESSGLFGGCFMHGASEAALVGGIGSIFGGAGGIYLYGQSTGHRGSYWAAAGGWTLGLAGSVGLVAVMADSDSDAVMGIAAASIVILPALGGTAGYVLSLEKGEPGPMPVGGLVEVHEGGPRLGVPNIDVALDQAGAIERVDVRLVGGRF